IAYAATQKGGFKTTDGGLHWHPTALTSYVTTLATDPSDPQRVFAGGFTGLFRTEDGGTTWPLQANGITDPSVDAAAIAVDPVTPQVVYVSVTSGVWVSNDHGGFWGFDGLGRALTEGLEVDPAHHQTVFAATLLAGMFRSDDQGSSWNPHNAGLRAAG